MLYLHGNVLIKHSFTGQSAYSNRLEEYFGHESPRSPSSTLYKNAPPPPPSHTHTHTQKEINKQNPAQSPWLLHHVVLRNMLRVIVTVSMSDIGSPLHTIGTNNPLGTIAHEEK